MSPFDTATGRPLKRFLVDRILEPLLSKRRLESYLVFWARLVRRTRKPFIIGITGTVGKSTTTAMIAAVLSHPDARRIVGEAASTVDNMNDNWGVSATLLRFDRYLNIPWDYPRRLAMTCLMPFRALRCIALPYPKVMVLECGAGPGSDFQSLVTIVPPDVAVVTTIGVAHLEMFSTLEGVVREKGLLVRAASPSGLVILGQDHAYVFRFEQMARAPVLKVGGEGFEVSRNITRAACRHMGIPAEVVEAALRVFKSPPGRLNQLQFEGMTVIDDSWNANPLSMKLGLDTLAQIAARGYRKLAILGDMAELGEEGVRYHEQMGAYARTRADVLIGVGELSRHYSPDLWFENSAACADGIESRVDIDCCVLVKGSHSAEMWKVVDKLKHIGKKREEQSGQC